MSKEFGAFLFIAAIVMVVAGLPIAGLLYHEQIERGKYLLMRKYRRKYKMPQVRKDLAALMEQGVVAFGYAEYYSIPILGGVDTQIGWRIDDKPVVDTATWDDGWDDFLKFIAQHASVPITVKFYDRGDFRYHKVVHPAATTV